ncbi:eukaryotic translation initiation factor 4E-binding protein 1 isoform X2 [Latimeria chalumnae]|uniref:eukaryotic translation initiation factor 4E-binding protein 1 isoform X2 n=1 Tax=Latimeria chalumnae TaxID=7897 RepID=UPI0003C19BE9|nr:PREDICTED: eukaryotic translation initiation factor 4E-binding protein 1 isoform X2 [Latimeria chalumnae]|eukprot:XP_006000416.1 PREDICTED: eukaryotic translation initiation factor 4E-binding protein 1 isoform X2 [Latimeria chalumnae]
MSSGCQNLQTQSKAIPTRRVTVNDTAQLPQDYSTTPGGTLFSTTPGGTRIIYDRKFLMECRNSPVAKTPPRDLPNIPGVTSPNTGDSKAETNHINNHEEKQAADFPNPE